MLAFIPPRPDYDTWLRIASAVWAVLPLEEGARLLHAWSPEERDGEYVGKFKHRLRQVGVGTLCHIAAQHGFDARAAARRKRWAGRLRFAESKRRPGEEADPAQDTAISGLISGEVSRERVMDAFDAGQSGDARLWCELRRGLRVWNVHSKIWMVYGDGVWSRDSAHATPWDLSDTLCRLYGGIVNSIRREMAEHGPPQGQKDPREKEIARLMARMDKLRSWDYLAGVEKFARRELHLPATAFDANPDILVLENGTLDFTEGLFREHRPADFATVRSPICFDPHQRCPQWQGFLDRFVPEVEMRQYLSRAVGYSLTGRVHEDALFFAHGKGANGKSTFFGVLKILLGDLMTTVPIAALLSAKSDNNFDYHKANMEGKRVVLTDEIPEGRVLLDSQVKAITGGDLMNARRPFESPYAFMPTHKLWLMGNHKPEIKGTDEGIWRRVHMLPFTVRIPEAERRPRHEVLAEFAAEAAGILNWALAGFVEGRDLGLKPPEQVVQATQEYRQESDQFGAFWEDCFQKVVGQETRISEISRQFAIWCERNGENARYRGTRKIRSVLAERGFSTAVGRREYPVVYDWVLKTDEESNIRELNL